MQAANTSYIFLVLFVISCCIKNIKLCTSFYCLNSCGSSQSTRGYKLIVANNRDEDIYRLTWPASAWPPRNLGKLYNSRLKQSYKQSQVDSDKRNMEPPFNLCVYGALDVAHELPPNYYSTWLGNFLEFYEFNIDNNWSLFIDILKYILYRNK